MAGVSTTKGKNCPRARGTTGFLAKEFLTLAHSMAAPHEEALPLNVPRIYLMSLLNLNGYPVHILPSSTPIVADQFARIS